MPSRCLRYENPPAVASVAEISAAPTFRGGVHSAFSRIGATQIGVQLTVVDAALRADLFTEPHFRKLGSFPVKITVISSFVRAHSRHNPTKQTKTTKKPP